MGETKHVIHTVETAPNPTLDKVAVRQHGASSQATAKFSDSKLRDEVGQAILRQRHPDTDRKVEQVVARTIESLRAKLEDNLAPLDWHEARDETLKGVEGVITDSLIADTVEAEFERDDMRMERVLYALSIRGRQREDGSGWSSVADVLDWIEEKFPNLAMSFPDSIGNPTKYEVTPRSTVQYPSWVLKKESRERERHSFDREKFFGSIRKAMLGRHKAEERAGLIGNWVLRGVEGQDRVHSAQLAVAIMDTLRRVDDIAYLRWATITKRISTIEDFVQEARELVLAPSARLEFIPEIVRDAEPGQPLI